MCVCVCIRSTLRRFQVNQYSSIMIIVTMLCIRSPELNSSRFVLLKLFLIYRFNTCLVSFHWFSYNKNWSLYVGSFQPFLLKMNTDLPCTLECFISFFKITNSFCCRLYEFSNSDLDYHIIFLMTFS